MRPVVSELLFQAPGGGPAILALLISLCHGYAASLATCPPSCLCASDIVSCSGHNLSQVPSDIPEYTSWMDLSHNSLTIIQTDWIGRPFDRLTTLILSWNSIGQIASDIFTITPHLRHLDLSFNRLTTLNTSTFHGLGELEVLLLFSNQITQTNPGAFSGLHSLRKVYLSGNRLRTFPLELYQGSGGSRNLSFLDLSSNMLSEVPIQSLLALPERQQSGVYLQGNPLVCDCALLAMLEYWTLKDYSPLVDFRDDYPCRMTGIGGRLGLNCGGSQLGKISNDLLTGGTHQIEPGDWLQVPCPGLALPPNQPRVEPIIFWITPSVVLRGPSHDPNGRLMILPDGSLEIRGAIMEDTGMYTCVAARGRPYYPGDSVEVTLLVGNSSVSGGSGYGGAEHFNTAFTTLASCVVSIILVLLYLYLTPCRCRQGRGEGGGRRFGGRVFLLCSDPREADSGDQRSNGKRVAFLEPHAKDGDECEPKTPSVNSAHGSTEGILKNGIRAVGGALADPAHVV